MFELLQTTCHRVVFWVLCVCSNWLVSFFFCCSGVSGTMSGKDFWSFQIDKLDQLKMSIYFFHWWLWLLLPESNTQSSSACKCNIPCNRNEYSGTFSKKPLDLDKIKLTDQKQATNILQRKQQAMDVSAKVCFLAPIWHAWASCEIIWSYNQFLPTDAFVSEKKNSDIIVTRNVF